MAFFLAPLAALTATAIGEIVATTVVVTVVTRVASDLYDKASLLADADDDED